MATILDVTKSTGSAVLDGVAQAATAQGLNSKDDFLAAATKDPLAYQVGSDLGASLARGQATS